MDFSYLKSRDVETMSCCSRPLGSWQWPPIVREMTIDHAWPHPSRFWRKKLCVADGIDDDGPCIGTYAEICRVCIESVHDGLGLTQGTLS